MDGQVISKVDEATQWCAGMVVVPKKNRAICVCVDLKPLNESVVREIHPIPTVVESLAHLNGAAVFSKIDANSGFWQIPLARESRLLTTFVTPFGRYAFNKLPFGISSAPEHFHKRMSKVLSGLEGLVCHMDDVLVVGANQTARLDAALKRIQETGVTLNSEKCFFSRKEVKFLGHVINKDGIHEDPANLKELRRFLGMVNQLAKLTPNLAEILQPLRELLSKRTTWCRDTAQERSFGLIKQELIRPPVLALYNLTAETKISADTSSHGLGAVLLQRSTSSNVWKPIAFASRAMSETEKHYAQIEKEALATTWACEKFSEYIVGRKILIETDHKPLVPLLSMKTLDRLPPRILRFLNEISICNCTCTRETPLHRRHTIKSSIYPNRYQQSSTTNRILRQCRYTRTPRYHETTQYLPSCSGTGSNLRNSDDIRQGRKITPELMPYWRVRGELTICDNLLLYCSQIVVPSSLKEYTLTKLYEGHQGIQRCRKRACCSVWWLGMSSDIYGMINQCLTCSRKISPKREPMICSQLPDYPWQKIGTDLFEIKGVTYLLVVDYFSRYPEVIRLTTTTSHSVIVALKSLFARYGIPQEIVSDNGLQYASQQMSEFAKSYGFKHTTSSPYYPQGNGQIERTVKTVKSLLIHGDKDPQLSLMSYRATPLTWCGISPAELLMGRKIRTCVPVIDKLLKPDWPYLSKFRNKEEAFKRKQKKEYDRRHRTRPLTPIADDTPVWINGQTPGRILSPANTPRSYMVSTPTGETRRNRRYLQIIPGVLPSSEPNDSITTRSPVMTRSRSGVVLVPPKRLSYERRGDVV